MISTVARPSARRADLQFGPAHEDGSCVLKDRRTGDCYRLGPEEAFLLGHLDGRPPGEVHQAYARRFGQSLTDDEFQEFMDLANAQGFLQSEREGRSVVIAVEEPRPVAPTPTPAARASSQSVLMLRFNVFDPDRLFARLVPLLSFLWSPTFALVSALGILSAVGIAWANRGELVSGFAEAFRWETALVVWVVLLTTAALHECAHGMTCKRYGGEVHEIGLLLIFFMPGLYCNVTDAWLFRERWKRLLVTVAGGYCDLCFWALAVFCWRATAQATFANYLACVVLSVIGARIALNCNPLIKLDGYYFLSDLVNVPNLQQHALQHALGWLRAVLWGGPRPEARPGSKFLLFYGLTSWAFGIVLLTLTFLAFTRFLSGRWGPLAGGATLLVAGLVLRGQFEGLFAGEVTQMFLKRHGRALAWCVALLIGLAYLAWGTMEDTSTGGFQLRPVVRVEVRAPTTGFVQELLVDEGAPVTPDTVLLRLHVPNLATRLGQHRAEVQEAEARLRLLRAGARPEELSAAQGRVDRARTARSRAEEELRRAREAFSDDLAQLQAQQRAALADVDYARTALDRARQLRGIGAVSEETVEEARRRYRSASAQYESATAQEHARRVTGPRDAEAEVTRRSHDLAEAEAAYRTLVAGARSEELEAEEARLGRTRQEGSYLTTVESQLKVRAPATGIVTTPGLRDRVGQYVHEGELLCVVEQPATLEAELLLVDQEVERVGPGQTVQFRLQAFPRLTLHGTVQRLAARANRREGVAPQSQLVVYCDVSEVPEIVRPGMVGVAKISRGRRPVRDVLADAAYRLIRAELWW